ncbi:hypothetical protein EJ03DRAFT_333235 [Teratosphaeria nubilosa]|uniref:Uncharacterized protein n=1 Tax=Teratosphaeria nubilosa TaxID=161662 RepID=A0A6G1LM90_9PEZI|nr:hypothetical protein EJ03DRAFT_333235 [Teratosphaeria nubilosa]
MHDSSAPSRPQTPKNPTVCETTISTADSKPHLPTTTSQRPETPFVKTTLKMPRPLHAIAILLSATFATAGVIVPDAPVGPIYRPCRDQTNCQDTLSGACPVYNCHGIYTSNAWDVFGPQVLGAIEVWVVEAQEQRYVICRPR